MEVIGKGVYGAAEASRLTKLRTRRVREWFKGRGSANGSFEPVFESDYPIHDDEFAISFLDLIDLNLAGKLRDANVPLSYVRKVYRLLRHEYGDHPFARRAIDLGDKVVFTRGLNHTESTRVLEAITRQSYFEKVIKPFLKSLDYDRSTQQAVRWHIADRIVIDPKIRFGQPVVEGTGIATSILRDSFLANGESAEFVARWFGIQPELVMAAVNFENDLAA